MSVPKAIFIGSLSLFIVIAGVAFFKKKQKKVVEDIIVKPMIEKSTPQFEEHAKEYLQIVQDDLAVQEVDEVWRLFTKGKKKFPFVETIRYKSNVPWLKGRPAWITDYASHFSTSRHFIARSLNGKRDYYTQKIATGDQFNVLKKEVHFYLVVDLSRCKMWFYAIDEDFRYLLKTYRLGLGRVDEHSYSGLLTPKGTFSLGNNVAIYKAGMTGHFQNIEVEMVRVFGTRWIPFSEELSDEGDSPRGYGLHGAPWIYDVAGQSYSEDLSTIGSYESDGCIRLAQNDIEELYAIVITKPTIVEIVTDFHDAKVPGEPIEH